ncbi:hypothetical protein ACJX0J_023344, partial [Zea mays]
MDGGCRFSGGFGHFFGGMIQSSGSRHLSVSFVLMSVRTFDFFSHFLPEIDVFFTAMYLFINLSLNFFSFSGDIEYVEMQSESEWSQLAYVTFKDSQGADTAVLLSGATIVDRAVIITPAENYQLPPEAHKQLSGANVSTESAVRKAEDVVSSMLAKGFVLSKDALNLARSFDERHNILSNATATVASLDRQYGLSEKINLGRAIVGSKVKEVDERYQVSELTKSALAAAEQKASFA